MLGRLLGAVSALALTLATVPAKADTLFSEDFDGYTSFPAQDPLFDHINPGIPLQSEGADEVWYGARFGSPMNSCGDGTINCDLAVQEFGNLTTNKTPVGRFEDDSGLLFSILTTGYVDVMLEFDWRTFSAGSADELVVGYYVGDIPASVFGPDMTADLRGTAYDWANWTELDRQSPHPNFTSESWALPDDAGTIWIAFWIDDGEGDYGKVDDVHVSAVLIPEPSTALLLLSGLFGLGWVSRRS